MKTPEIRIPKSKKEIPAKKGPVSASMDSNNSNHKESILSNSPLSPSILMSDFYEESYSAHYHSPVKLGKNSESSTFGTSWTGSPNNSPGTKPSHTVSPNVFDKHQNQNISIQKPASTSKGFFSNTIAFLPKIFTSKPKSTSDLLASKKSPGPNESFPNAVKINNLDKQINEIPKRKKVSNPNSPNFNAQSFEFDQPSSPSGFECCSSHGLMSETVLNDILNERLVLLGKYESILELPSATETLGFTINVEELLNEKLEKGLCVLADAYGLDPESLQISGFSSKKEQQFENMFLDWLVEIKKLYPSELRYVNKYVKQIEKKVRLKAQDETEDVVLCYFVGVVRLLRNFKTLLQKRENLGLKKSQTNQNYLLKLNAWASHSSPNLMEVMETNPQE